MIATGGSVVYSANVMARLASFSTIVFLDVGLATISAHIASQAPRGIVGMAGGGLEKLFRERRPRYLQYADLTVHCSNETAEQVAEKVLSVLAKEKPIQPE